MMGTPANIKNTPKKETQNIISKVPNDFKIHALQPFFSEQQFPLQNWIKYYFESLSPNPSF